MLHGTSRGDMPHYTPHLHADTPARIFTPRPWWPCFGGLASALWVRYQPCVVRLDVQAAEDATIERKESETVDKLWYKMDSVPY